MSARRATRTLLGVICCWGSVACRADLVGTASAEPAGLVILAGDSQVQFPGTGVFARLSVGLVDSAGERIMRGGVRVAWTVLRGGGTATAVNDTTTDQGIGQAEWVMGPDEAENAVEAAALDLPPVEFTARAVAPGPIVFVSGRRHANLGNEFEGYPGDLYVMKDDGTDVMPLFPASADVQFVFDPSWSPDGTQILFSRSLGRPAGGTPGLLPLGLFVIGADGSGDRQVPSSGFPPHVDYLMQPSWSPEGTRIVARLDTAQGVSFPPEVSPGRLHLLNRDGTGIRPLSTPALAASDPSWSAATGRIAFACRMGDEKNICVADDDGENFLQLTSGLAEDSEPTWSPDGSRLLFVRQSEGDRAVWMVNADGSELERVIAGAAGGPAWSPDGTRFLVTVGDGDDGSDIYVVDPADGSMANLTRSTSRDRAAAWRSP